jgi:hypothetical protein
MSKILDLAAMGVSIERADFGERFKPGGSPWKAMYKGEMIASGATKRQAASYAVKWCSAHADELRQDRESH